MDNALEIDLIILDMVMPGMGGGKTFDSLREINPEVKVILSSGYSINGEAQQILARGCKGLSRDLFGFTTCRERSRGRQIVVAAGRFN